jgi:hypothetical protein
MGAAMAGADSTATTAASGTTDSTPSSAWECLPRGDPYYYPYPYDYPYMYPAPVVVEPGPPVAQEPIQREVVYPTGKYVLHGDGITDPWQWVWIPAAPPPSPPPAP